MELMRKKSKLGTTGTTVFKIIIFLFFYYFLFYSEEAYIMLLNEKKYSTLRGIYYNEIKKVRENPNLNEDEKAVLIKINQRRIELLNEEARALNLYKDLFEEVA